MKASWLLMCTFPVAALFACSATPDANHFAGNTGSGAGSTGTQGSAGSTGSNGTGNGGGTTFTDGGPTSSSSGGGPMKLSAYAHTNTVLYTLDPSQPSLALAPVGTFECIGGNGQDSSMTDVAVNEAGDVWGVSAHNVYKLALPSAPGLNATVHCALIIPIKNSTATFYGLTFAPAGVLGSSEVLVAANTAGELWEVDTMGNLTQHGTFGTVPPADMHGHSYQYPGKEFELSGDIVFLANNGNPLGFATVRDCPNPPSSSGCNQTDTLVELDLKALAQKGAQVVTKSIRGQIVKAPGCNDPANNGYGSMYGIAAFQDKVFGFSHQGYVVTINNNDATACLTLSTQGDSWAGAAITTVAPVMPPTTM
jgi:hypothetical protein